MRDNHGQRIFRFRWGGLKLGHYHINTHSTANCLLNYLWVRLWGKSRDYSLSCHEAFIVF